VASSRQRTTALSFLFFNLWVFRIGIRSKVDIIHCHDLSPLPAGWLLSRLKRTPLIYDAHENVPTMYQGRKGRFLTRLERVLIPRVSAVISAGKRLADVMPERGARRVVYIGNWKRLEDYVPDNRRMDALRQQYGITGDSIVISYLGTIDPTREIHVLLDAVRQSPDVVLLIGGRGLLQDDVITAAQGAPNIHWLGWVDSSEIPLYSLLADAIYSVRNDRDFPELNYIAPAPHKLFESFAAGRIVIAKRGVNEMGDILEELQAGILLDEVTPKTLIAAFEQLKDPESRRALEQKALKAREQYNWNVAEERLAHLYALLLEDRRN
jgi:glycosyltransferase involved in cell wall biosynthesis